MGKLRPSSSIAGDVWHGDTGTPGYEWWYFDALSDDGRDALVIIFLTNFIFSPRYNRAAASSLRHRKQTSTTTQFPAVAVFFYRDGRPLLRAINEYSLDDFAASTTRPECHIGQSTFRLIETDSQSRYELNIETRMRRERRLHARLTWAVKEGNLLEEQNETAPHGTVPDEAAHDWNMAAPRCEVSGQIALSGKKGGRFFEQEFRGTGYHDHNRDARWMPATIAEWHWGRFHFPDATAVFYRYRERGEDQYLTRLFLIQEGLLSILRPEMKAGRTRRQFFGLRYPSVMEFQTSTADTTSVLHVCQNKVMDSSFFYLRFLSEATLETPGGGVRQARGITEYLAPRSLSYSPLRWLINMRIGSNGRAAFLP